MKAGLAKLANARDDFLLGRVRFHMLIVGRQLLTEWDASDVLFACFLVAQGEVRYARR
jgi:hypothetical protein